MTPNWNAVRTALALPLSALLLAGCFWLEPISQYNPDGVEPGQDAGTTPDGGGQPDGGTEPEPLECGQETPVPQGASVHLPGGDRGWMYMDPGDVLLPGEGGLRLRLAERFTAEVPVALRSTNNGVVEPESEWFCFAADSSEVVVGLRAKDAGNARLDVLVGGVVQAHIEVTVVNSEPTFTVFPNHGYYNPGEELNVTLELSHPSRNAATVWVVSDGGGEPIDQVEIPAGTLQVTATYEFVDAPELLLRAYSDELGHEESLEFRRAPQHVLISEVLLDPQHGFVELYNPTGEQKSLEGLKLFVHANAGVRELHQFGQGYAVEPYSYLLLGWGTRATGANIGLTSTGDLYTSRRLILGARNGDSGSISSYIDGIRYREGWQGYDGNSLERMAWAEATRDEMRPGGLYEWAGNAHDTDNSDWPEEDSLLDFIRRPEPQPQAAGTGTESFFGP